jgi:hypothetical protein
MINQRGGLKRKDSAGELNSTDILLQMINSEEATLNFLVNPGSSLKGIIAVLKVKPEHSAYEGLNPETGKFNLQVSTFIIKFTITTPSGNRKLYYDLIKKKSESNNSFLEETMLQQKIWIESILGKKPAIEICPSIGSLLLLNNVNGNKFLRLIPDSDVKSILKGFLSLKKDVERLDIYPPGLGILLMQNVEHSQTLSSIPVNYVESDDNNYLRSICILIAQVVRLFVFLQVIHFDLHTNNVLFFFQNDKIMCKLIDFGLASDVSNSDSDFFLSTEEKRKIFADIKTFSSKFYELSGYVFDEVDEPKIEFIRDVMDYLKTQDIKISEKSGIHDGSYQMNWYENVKSNDRLLLKAFELLREIIIVSVDAGTGLCSNTIKRYTGKGKLFSVGSVEYIVESVESSSAGCSIMGGKRKTKKYKKSKKTRKHKKTKKTRKHKKTKK